METKQDISCPVCGRPLAAAGAPCSYCAESQGGFHIRPLFLVLVLIISAAFCTATVFAARFYASKQQRLGARCFAQGQAALAAGQPETAIQDFRNALYYSHDNRDYRLRLAEALVAAKHIREAQSYLLTLWQDEPSNSTVNLQLARLAARQGETQSALRYYHGAIYGLWPEGNAAALRRQARSELIRYLLRLHDFTQADAELIALTPELPADASAHTEVGWLFLQAGDQSQALTEFEQALRLNPRDNSALLGAGQAAFNLARYVTAERYLERAVRMEPNAPRGQELLATSRLILEWNPYARGVSSKQRALRIVQAFRQAGQRLAQCAAIKGIDLTAGAISTASATAPNATIPAPAPQTNSSSLVAKLLSRVRPGASAVAPVGPVPSEVTPAQMQQLYEQIEQLKPDVRVYKVERDPQVADTAMGLVTQIETTTAQQCGAPKGPDLALLLLAHQAEER